MSSFSSTSGARYASCTIRLKAVEEENARLKKLLAESMMDVSTLREMLAKNF